MKNEIVAPFVLTRRKSMGHLLAGTLASMFYGTSGAFAEALTPTLAQTEGPFYPKELPLDTDNDLLILNDNITPAVGTVAYVSGKILDSRGQPVRNATVEIWQCDSQGAYLHQGSSNFEKRDRNFQSFGRFLTGASGEYLFRTIKPVAYPGRTPHIHFKIKHAGKEILTTQLYNQAEAANAKDMVWKRIKDEKARQNCTAAFVPIPDAKAGELAAKFDIVLGLTPPE